MSLLRLSVLCMVLALHALAIPERRGTWNFEVPLFLLES